MHRDSAAQCRTLERKQAFVLAADDASLVAELRGFFHWALADRDMHAHLLVLLEPPAEVTRFVEESPRLVADAGDVVNWMRAKEPRACTEVVPAANWEECDRLVALAREQATPEVADRAAYVFAIMNAARDGVGRAFRDRTDEESVAAWHAALDLGRVFEHLVRERNLAVRVSPSGALLQLVALCRGSDIPDGTKHWSDFARGAVGFGVEPLESVARARPAFRRLVEGLMTSIESTSNSGVTLRRFVQRTTLFDSERVSQLAALGGETALTLDLAKYLYDAGLPIVIHPHVRRPRVPIPEPAIGARAVLSTEGDPAKVLDGLRELNAELLALDAAGFDVREGLLAIFVVSGSPFELPREIHSARFMFRFETIDLRMGETTQSEAWVRISVQVALSAVG